MVLLRACEFPLPYDVNVFVRTPLGNHRLTFYRVHYIDWGTDFLYLSFRKVLEERNAEKKFDFFGFQSGIVNGKAVHILCQVQGREVALGSSHYPCCTQWGLAFNGLLHGQITEHLPWLVGMHLPKLPKLEFCVCFQTLDLCEKFNLFFIVGLQRFKIFNPKWFWQNNIALVFLVLVVEGWFTGSRHKAALRYFVFLEG